MIEFACTHCGEEMSSPEELLQKFDHCPRCGRRVKVKPGAGRDRKIIPSDRQLQYAHGVGLLFPPEATRDNISTLLDQFESLKLYFFTAWIVWRGKPAKDDGIAHKQIEQLSAQLVNAKLPVVKEICDELGRSFETESTSDPEDVSWHYIESNPTLFEHVKCILRRAFPQVQSVGFIHRVASLFRKPAD